MIFNCNTKTAMEEEGERRKGKSVREEGRKRIQKREKKYPRTCTYIHTYTGFHSREGGGAFTSIKKVFPLVTSFYRYNMCELHT